MYDVIIVGAGPAGLFTAYELSKENNLKILLVEKGKFATTRFCPMSKTGKCVNCDPCAILSGYGGAGTFSDGKLNFIPNYDEEKHALRLPIDKIARFTSNERKIYAYLDYQKNYKQDRHNIDDLISTSNQAIVSNSDANSNFYVVKKGDNLGKIADKYNLSLNELKSLNNLKNNSIAVGKRLNVSKNNKALAANNVKATKNTSTYVVKKGDTLSSIAKRYKNISAADLMKKNNIRNATSLKPGMTLII